MNFSEARIQAMLGELRDEFGPDIATRELAILELEDLERKGCTHESARKFDLCLDCQNFENCPVLDWQKRHPEYANDELAMKIKVLEAGGEEAYREKQKRIEEAKKKAEAKKLAVQTAKEKLFADILLKQFAQTPKDTEAWTEKFETDLEAYVQARLADK